MANTPITNPRICKILQTNLTNTFGTLTAQSEDPMAGTLKALMSEENKRGIKPLSLEEAVRGGNIPNGSITTGRQVILAGYDANCVTGIDTAFDPCSWTASQAVSKPVYNSYTVAQSAGSTPRTFTIAEIKALCEGRDEVITENLRQMKNEVIRKMNTMVATSAIAAMGSYTDGVSSITTPRTLNLINSSNNSINFLEFSKLKVEYQKKGYNEKLIVVGGDEMAYVQTIQNALGLSSGGVNLAGAPLPSIYTDFGLDTIYGANSNMISWIPKTLQFIEWFENEQAQNRFKGALVELDGNVVYEEEWSTIDIDGMKFDIYTKYDKCLGYKMTLHKYFDLATLPTAATCTNKYPALHYLLACGSASC